MAVPTRAGKRSPDLLASPAVILTAPAYGDESAAFSIRAGDGTTVALFIGRVDRSVTILQIQSKDQVDSTLVKKIVGQAVAKLTP